MKILREKRGLSRGQAILFGLRSRAKGVGWLRSLTKTTAILAIDSYRAIVGTLLRFMIVKPLGLLRKTVRAVTGAGPKPLRE